MARARCATLPPLACAASGTARWGVVALGPAAQTLPPFACATSGTARWGVVGAWARWREPSRRSLVPLRAPLAGALLRSGPLRDPPAVRLCHFGHRSLAGHAPQDQKERNARCRMQHEIGQMMAPCAQPENLAIEHVRDHGKRIPLPHRPALKRLPNAGGGQPLADQAVAADEPLVVVGQKAEPQGLAVDDRDRHHQKAGNRPREPGGIAARRRIGKGHGRGRGSRCAWTGSAAARIRRTDQFHLGRRGQSLQAAAISPASAHGSRRWRSRRSASRLSRTAG